MGLNREERQDQFRAMSRAALRGSALEFGAIAVVCLGLYSGAWSIARSLAPRLGDLREEFLVSLLVLLFGASLSFAIWSFSRPRSTWSDDLKNIVPLKDFLGLPNSVLAPNLEDGDRAGVLRHLEVLSAREDVIEVEVGLLPDEGDISDRVLVTTYASADAIQEWASALKADPLRVSSLKFKVAGGRRRVRGILFVWD